MEQRTRYRWRFLVGILRLETQDCISHPITTTFATKLHALWKAAAIGDFELTWITLLFKKDVNSSHACNSSEHFTLGSCKYGKNTSDSCSVHLCNITRQRKVIRNRSQAPGGSEIMSVQSFGEGGIALEVLFANFAQSTNQLASSFYSVLTRSIRYVEFQNNGVSSGDDRAFYRLSRAILVRSQTTLRSIFRSDGMLEKYVGLLEACNSSTQVRVRAYGEQPTELPW